MKPFGAAAVFGALALACGSSNSDAGSEASGGSSGSGGSSSGAAGDGGSSSGGAAGQGSGGAAGGGATGGCPDAPLDAGNHPLTLEHDGLTRKYNLHIPSSLGSDDAAPLVLNFHGYTSNAQQQEIFSLMTPKSDAEGFVLAYPEGTGTTQSWNAGVCCGTAISDGVDDVGFARALIDEIATKVCIDRKRVYSTGMSNGGYLSHRLACEAADVFAAVAPVSSVLGVPEATCTPARPIPIVTFNGTADGLVSYPGSAVQPGAVKSAEIWAEKNGCTGEPTESFKKGTATCMTYDSCEGVSVTYCTLEGMGHCWPGQTFCPFGDGTADLSANDAMWDLFEKSSLP